MNAKELRIGNWVMGNKPFQVKGSDISLYESREKAQLKGVLQGSQLPEPIPLTEEWLERFGFEKQPEFMWLGNGADWQPEYPRTYHEDYYNGEFVFRFTKWQWLDKEDKVHSEESIEFLRTNESYYSKIYEGNIQFNSLEYVHELQNLVFALTGRELEYDRD